LDFEFRRFDDWNSRVESLRFTGHLGLFKIFFYFESFVHESNLLSFFPPAYIAHTVAILLARLSRNIRSPLDLPFVCHTPYNIGNNNIV